jgi:hypothetical protein
LEIAYQRQGNRMCACCALGSTTKQERDLCRFRSISNRNACSGCTKRSRPVLHVSCVSCVSRLTQETGLVSLVSLVLHKRQVLCLSSYTCVSRLTRLFSVSGRDLRVSCCPRHLTGLEPSVHAHLDPCHRSVTCESGVWCRLEARPCLAPSYRAASHVSQARRVLLRHLQVWCANSDS